METYKLIKKKEIEDNELKAQTVAHDFRDATRHLVKAGRAAKVGKGSFGPTFNAGEDLPNQGDAGGDSTAGNNLNQGAAGEDDHLKQGTDNQHGGNRRRKATRKRTSEALEDEPRLTGRRVCRGCGQLHDESKCYYLFPDQRPDWFVERPQTKRAAEEALKQFKDLADMVRKAKKAKISESPKNQKDD